MKQQTAYMYKRVGSAQIVQKARNGKFQITEMKLRYVKTAANESQRDYIPELDITRDKICVQYSTYNRYQKDYNNQQIWLTSREELEQLRDTLNEFLDDASDEEASFSFCKDAHSPLKNFPKIEKIFSEVEIWE